MSRRGRIVELYVYAGEVYREVFTRLNVDDFADWEE